MGFPGPGRDGDSSGPSSRIGLFPVVTGCLVVGVAGYLLFAPFATPPAEKPVSTGGSTTAGSVAVPAVTDNGLASRMRGLAVPGHANLRLLAIKRRGGNRAAYIAVDNDSPRWFVAGDKIPGGLLLEELAAGSVLLRRTADIESLVLDSTLPLAGDGTAARKTSGEAGSRGATAARAGTDMALVPFPDGVESEGVERVAGNQYLVDRAAINRQLNTGHVFRHAKFLPEKEGGFAVTSIAHGSLYEKMGLRDDDVIRSVNGKRLSSLADAMATFGDYMTYDRAEMTIERNGRPVALYYYLE